MKFLLEIGVEEIPDWMLGPAMAHLRESFDKAVATLEGKVTLAEATPRRLVIIADGLREREADREELVTGPPKTANPQALAGFAKKQGIAVEALSVVETAKGEFYGFTRKIEGRTAQAILEAELPGLILGIPWPKTMAWAGKGSAR
jgi:glycyl-tRNA synthetase beta chain